MDQPTIYPTHVASPYRLPFHGSAAGCAVSRFFYQFGPLLAWLLLVITHPWPLWPRLLSLAGAVVAAAVAVWPERGRLAAIAVTETVLDCNHWWARGAKYPLATVRGATVRFPTVVVDLADRTLELPLRGDQWLVAARLSPPAAEAPSSPFDGAVYPDAIHGLYLNRGQLHAFMASGTRLLLLAVAVVVGVALWVAGCGLAPLGLVLALAYAGMLATAELVLSWTPAITVSTDEITTTRMALGELQVPVSALRLVYEDPRRRTIVATTRGDFSLGLTGSAARQAGLDGPDEKTARLAETLRTLASQVSAATLPPTPAPPPAPTSTPDPAPPGSDRS